MLQLLKIKKEKEKRKIKENIIPEPVEFGEVHARVISAIHALCTRSREEKKLRKHEKKGTRGLATITFLHLMEPKRNKNNIYIHIYTKKKEIQYTHTHTHTHNKDKRATRVIAAIHPLRREKKYMEKQKNYIGRIRHPRSLHQQRGGGKQERKQKAT
jgi:hypothetical protein